MQGSREGIYLRLCKGPVRGRCWDLSTAMQGSREGALPGFIYGYARVQGGGVAGIYRRLCKGPGRGRCWDLSTAMQGSREGALLGMFWSLPC